MSGLFAGRHDKCPFSGFVWQRTAPAKDVYGATAGRSQTG
jgi:hypothetical protein